MKKKCRENVFQIPPVLVKKTIKILTILIKNYNQNSILLSNTQSRIAYMSGALELGGVTDLLPRSSTGWYQSYVRQDRTIAAMDGGLLCIQNNQSLTNLNACSVNEVDATRKQHTAC